MASKPIWRGRRSALAGLALAGFALAPFAARADSFFDLFSPSVSPYAVQSNLARSGFAPRSAMVRRGDVYVYDVADRYGVAQRLVIDARTGRVLERYSLRPPSWAVARRPDVHPPEDAPEWGYAPRPEVDVPMTPPRVIEGFPVENPPEPPRISRQRQLAYGDGHAATPLAAPAPEPKLPEKPKLRIVRPKPIPSPSASDQPQTATALPSAADPADPSAIPQGGQPATTQVAPAPAKPAVAEPSAPATTGVVASSAAPEAPAAKAPPPQPAPAPVAKGKAINDIPVAPLD